MAKFFKNYWTLILWLATVLVDAEYQILEHLISDPFWVNIVRGVGSILLAYFTKENLKSKPFNVFADDDTDIGGGGIKNPKNGG